MGRPENVGDDEALVLQAVERSGTLDQGPDSLLGMVDDDTINVLVALGFGTDGWRRKVAAEATRMGAGESVVLRLRSKLNCVICRMNGRSVMFCAPQYLARNLAPRMSVAGLGSFGSNLYMDGTKSKCSWSNKN